MRKGLNWGERGRMIQELEKSRRSWRRCWGCGCCPPSPPLNPRRRQGGCKVKAGTLSLSLGATQSQASEMQEEEVAAAEEVVVEEEEEEEEKEAQEEEKGKREMRWIKTCGEGGASSAAAGLRRARSRPGGAWPPWPAGEAPREDPAPPLPALPPSALPEAPGPGPREPLTRIHLEASLGREHTRGTRGCKSKSRPTTWGFLIPFQLAVYLREKLKLSITGT